MIKISSAPHIWVGVAVYVQVLKEEWEENNKQKASTYRSQGKRKKMPKILCDASYLYSDIICYKLNQFLKSF